MWLCAGFYAGGDNAYFELAEEMDLFCEPNRLCAKSDLFMMDAEQMENYEDMGAMAASFGPRAEEVDECELGADVAASERRLFTNMMEWFEANALDESAESAAMPATAIQQQAELHEETTGGRGFSAVQEQADLEMLPVNAPLELLKRSTPRPPARPPIRLAASSRPSEEQRKTAVDIGELRHYDDDAIDEVCVTMASSVVEGREFAPEPLELESAATPSLTPRAQGWRFRMVVAPETGPSATSLKDTTSREDLSFPVSSTARRGVLEDIESLDLFPAPRGYFEGIGSSDLSFPAALPTTRGDYEGIGSSDLSFPAALAAPRIGSLDSSSAAPCGKASSETAKSGSMAELLSSLRSQKGRTSFTPEAATESLEPIRTARASSSAVGFASSAAAGAGLRQVQSGSSDGPSEVQAGGDTTDGIVSADRAARIAHARELESIVSCKGASLPHQATAESRIAGRRSGRIAPPPEPSKSVTGGGGLALEMNTGALPCARRALARRERVLAAASPPAPVTDRGRFVSRMIAEAPPDSRSFLSGMALEAGAPRRPPCVPVAETAAPPPPEPFRGRESFPSGMMFGAPAPPEPFTDKESFPSGMTFGAAPPLKPVTGGGIFLAGMPSGAAPPSPESVSKKGSFPSGMRFGAAAPPPEPVTGGGIFPSRMMFGAPPPPPEPVTGGEIFPSGMTPGAAAPPEPVTGGGIFPSGITFGAPPPPALVTGMGIFPSGMTFGAAQQPKSIRDGGIFPSGMSFGAPPSPPPEPVTDSGRILYALPPPAERLTGRGSFTSGKRHGVAPPGRETESTEMSGAEMLQSSPAGFKFTSGKTLAA